MIVDIRLRVKVFKNLGEIFFIFYFLLVKFILWKIDLFLYVFFIGWFFRCLFLCLCNIFFVIVFFWSMKEVMVFRNRIRIIVGCL